MKATINGEIQEGSVVEITAGKYKGHHAKVTRITKQRQDNNTFTQQFDILTVHILDAHDNEIYDTVLRSEARLVGLNSQELEKLQEEWVQTCNFYLRLFCAKHGYPYEPDAWVGVGIDNVGTTVEVCDMFIGMDDIRYDIDHDVDENVFEQWYWKALEVYELTSGSETYMNYPSFCKGAPDYWTEERMKALREGATRVKQARENLEKEIAEFKTEQKRWKATEDHSRL